MKTCHNCGHTLNDDVSFCAQCSDSTDKGSTEERGERQKMNSKLPLILVALGYDRFHRSFYQLLRPGKKL